MENMNGWFELSTDQIGELSTLAQKMRAKVGYSATSPAVRIGHHARDYLTSLALDAARESDAYLIRPWGGIRQDSVKAFESHLGRPATAKDMLKTIAAFVTVPRRSSPNSLRGTFRPYRDFPTPIRS